MKKFTIERAPAPVWMRTLLPIIAIPVTFLITSIIILLDGANPFTAYYNFLIAPLASKSSAIEVLVKSTPLLLTGAAVAFAFKGGYWNIGAEGQLYAGAISAAFVGTILVDVPPIIGIPAMIIGGFVGGLIWALPSAILKVKLGVDEVVTTLLMNSIVLNVTSFLLNGPWRNPVSMWPQSPEIQPGTMFPQLLPRTRLHFGIILAVLVILITWFVINRTSFGLKMRAIGLSKEGARFAGIKVNKTMLTVALISGGIAGLAGAGEVAGIHFHLIDAISDGLGYSGIIIATLGGLNPFGVGLAALFIGLIDTGAQTVSRVMGVPVYLGDVVQSTLLLVTLSLFVLQNYRIRRVK
ncbi:MAG: ABC transporter permease [Chloroflexi bacterium HGW-Chloroflexi-4]|jgi:simple sugar transport system permease protein|nr:MAG: ABC transporter permease [Chloroflexi bacterium HGW-Chloroflexi-4]